MTLRALIHLLLHVAVPGAVARTFFRARWWQAWLVMMATMLVDLDHLLAVPLYDPNRCSIGFHPLHTAPAVAAYVLLALWPRTSLVGVGLLIHMALDASDCALMRL
ncbi:MAG TPA: DUF6122 family protein [Verrucomicrobiae bacterium]|nr:DUF6122 family protein [Verrucomicrobiae bacterium]